MQTKSNKRITQCRQILGYMRLHGSITQWQAIKRFRITRLSGRIFDLKLAGIGINPENVSKNGKRFTKYHLAKG